MRIFLNRLFEVTGYLAGLFMIGTLLAVLSSIFGRFIPALELHGADAYAGYCMAACGFLALAQQHPARFRVINGDAAPDLVADAIRSAVAPHLPNPA